MFCNMVPVFLIFLQISISFGYVVRQGENQNAKQTQVAFKCGFRNRFLNQHQEWSSDIDKNAVCLHASLDILKYCRKIYPEKNITNIAQDIKTTTIKNWCPTNDTSRSSCGKEFRAKTYLCLSIDDNKKRPIVPDGCVFDHIDDRTKCDTYEILYSQSVDSCGKAFEDKIKMAKIVSFDVLKPCGLQMFTAFESMCCMIDKNGAIEENVEDEDDDESESSEERDDEIEEDSRNIKIDAAKSTKSIDVSKESQIDHYLRTADLTNEHANFKDALLRLEENHRHKVTQIMDQWNKLEDRYNTMSDKKSDRALNFRRKMTDDYKNTMTNLNQKTSVDRQKLSEVHEKRILVDFNEHYKNSLNRFDDLHNQEPSKVLDAAKVMIKLVEKFRLYVINRYRSDLRKDRANAVSRRQQLVNLLLANDRSLNHTLLSLNSSTMKKMYSASVNFWQSLREGSTPEVDNDGLLWLGNSQNTENLFQYYENAIDRSSSSENLISTSTILDRQFKRVTVASSASILNNRLEQSFVKPEKVISPPGIKNYGSSVTFFLGVTAFVTLLGAIYSVFKRFRKPTRCGFVGVESSSPEERHVSRMQVNGYSNPTYKFFDQA